MTKREGAVIILFVRGHSSSGRAPPCQGGGSEFEPRCPLQRETGHPVWMSCFLAEGELDTSTPTREARFQSEGGQGSREWPKAVGGMPGSEFSLVVRSLKRDTPTGVSLFGELSDFAHGQNRPPAGGLIEIVRKNRRGFSRTYHFCCEILYCGLLLADLLRSQ